MESVESIGKIDTASLKQLSDSSTKEKNTFIENLMPGYHKLEKQFDKLVTNEVKDKKVKEFLEKHKKDIIDMSINLFSPADVEAVVGILKNNFDNLTEQSFDNFKLFADFGAKYNLQASWTEDQLDDMYQFGFSNFKSADRLNYTLNILNKTYKTNLVEAIYFTFYNGVDLSESKNSLVLTNILSQSSTDKFLVSLNFVTLLKSDLVDKKGNSVSFEKFIDLNSKFNLNNNFNASYYLQTFDYSQGLILQEKLNNNKLTYNEFVLFLMLTRGDVVIATQYFGNMYHKIFDSLSKKIFGKKVNTPEFKNLYIHQSIKSVEYLYQNSKFTKEEKENLFNLAQISDASVVWMYKNYNLSGKDKQNIIAANIVNLVAMKTPDYKLPNAVKLLNKLGISKFQAKNGEILEVNEKNLEILKQKQAKDMLFLMVNGERDWSKMKEKFLNSVKNLLKADKNMKDTINEIFSEQEMKQMQAEFLKWPGDPISFIRYYLFDKKKLQVNADVYNQDINQKKVVYIFIKILQGNLKEEKIDNLDNNKNLIILAEKALDKVKTNPKYSTLIEQNKWFFVYAISYALEEALFKNTNDKNIIKITPEVLQLAKENLMNVLSPKISHPSLGKCEVKSNYTNNKSNQINRTVNTTSGESNLSIPDAEKSKVLFEAMDYIPRNISVQIDKNSKKISEKGKELGKLSQMSFSDFAHNLEAVEAEKDLLKSSSEGYAKQEVEKLTLKEGEIKHQEIDGLHIFEYRIGAKQYRLLSLTMFNGNQVILEDFVKAKTWLKIDFVGRPDDFKMFSDDLTKDTISANDVSDTLKFIKNYIFEKFFANPGEKEKEFVKKYNLNPEDLYKKEEEFYKNFSNAIKAETNIGGFEFDFGRLKLDLSTLSEDYFDKTKWSENEEKVKEGKFKLSASAKKEDTIWSKIGHILSSIARS